MAAAAGLGVWRDGGWSCLRSVEAIVAAAAGGYRLFKAVQGVGSSPIDCIVQTVHLPEIRPDASC